MEDEDGGSVVVNEDQEEGEAPFDAFGGLLSSA